MRRSAVSPFASPRAASGYEAWYKTKARRADRLEKPLFRQMLARFPQASSLLGVGCGTGHFSRWFKELRLQAAGLDLSLPMLAEATHLGSLRCVHSDALALPFSSAAFELVALITTPEFVA
jgi:ubiquinone/menaquinone biosynthesis C-methylase UbiE